MKFEFCMVYITTTDRKEADLISKTLVEKRLAACANIFEDMESMYHWKSKIESDNECVVILKTKVVLFGELNEVVKNIHSYENPCVVAYPMLDGNSEYLDWIRNETK
ncbi:divalent-cation tolerance protein CutA [Leptospira sp. GIMC2001]|uniref:divalent-cation tolerance protein CutA n=1 Tax=Leptospira sp. GIMC2001 TaxID=1513297 RepID=UPI002349E71C|nr:divalent-cation tolerance protein CutA [Leptospira sp. GIMC2001]WCL49314.1 divalent-cation tolerance protein CutA [Leptospira sp. GIMC2001]